MSRPRLLESFVVGITALALIAAPMTAARAAETVISTDDFSSPLSASWQQSGGPSLSLQTVGTDDVLQVANRANDFDGIETAPGVLVAGETYSVSMRVRLAADTEGTATFRMVSVPGFANAGTPVSVTDDAWVTLTGEWAVPAGATGAKLYIGTSNLTGAYTYLIDDLVLSRTDADPEPEPEFTVIASDDFSSPLSASWQQSGGPSLSLQTVGTDDVLQVANRANDFDGIETAPGVLVAGETYSVSMRVRLAADTEGTATFRMVSVPGFANAGTPVSVTDDAWVTLTGEWAVPAGATGAKLYIGTSNLTGAYTYLIDDLVLSQLTTDGDGDGGDGDGPGDPGTPGEVVLSTSFETGLDGWVPRADGSGAATVAVSTVQAYDGVQSALISNRISQGQGIGFDITDTLLPLVTYDVSAWVRFETGQPTDSVVLSVASTTGGSTSYTNLVTATGLSNSEWRELTGSFTIPASDSALLYFETAFAGGAAGNTSAFYIDDIEIAQAEELVIQDDLTPIKSTVDFPVGVAIDARETAGAQDQLVNLHFEQVTAENSMKPEAFYNGAREFIAPADATAVMDFAAENDLRVWGHTLVWHAQTPAWFFQTAGGQALTNSESDQQILRDRMREHIFNVAELYADEYGPYGGGNPIVAFDVVNEVVSDGNTTPGGLRDSAWFRILGESFIDLAFQYADEAFNEEFAAPGADRPVALFINDYNTELTPKGTRMLALLERLIDRDVPVDGIGHQMHVSLSFPVDDLGATLERFAPLGIKQAVTELDVTTGADTTPLFIDQGYFYRDAFRDFREFHAETNQLFSVTVWGLSDNRSWRAANGGPLLFDAELQAKPAYFGVVDGELGAPQRAANVFGATVTEADDPQWLRMPDIRIESEATFQVRWADDELFVLVEVEDATPQASDSVQLQVGDTTLDIDRDDAQIDTATGWSTVAAVPLTAATEGSLVLFDVRIIDNGSVRSAWNSPDVLGTLTLLEPLSFVEIVETPDAVVVDGVIDDAWDQATVIETDKQVFGTTGATAEVSTLWRGNLLYVLMEVTDPVIDLEGTDPWTKDSVEIYVDSGNFKNGSYRYDDLQLRVNADNGVTIGAVDENFQLPRLQTATARTTTGYLVEVSIDLLGGAGPETVHGFDFQVNDGFEGNRVSIRNWADPSGQGYLSTSRWGVGQLVAAPDAAPQLVLEPGSPRAGETIDFTIEGLEPGSPVELVLVPESEGAAGAAAVRGVAVVTAGNGATAAMEFPLSLGTFTADENGRVSGTVTIPAAVPPGDYQILALVDGEEIASAPLGIRAAADGEDRLSDTGVSADLATLLLIAGLLLAGGLVVVLRNGRRAATRIA
jgi:endo-1,4-beta-xylanase